MKKVIASVLFLGMSPMAGAQAMKASGELIRAAAPGPIPNEAYMDRSVDACEDFYAYACGGWEKSRSIPADQERIAVFGDLNMRNRELLEAQLKQAASHPNTSLQRQYGNFYQACMDTEHMDELGLQPLAPTLRAITGLTSPARIAEYLAARELTGYGLVALSVERDRDNPERWVASVKPAALTLPTPQDYTEQSESATQHRASAQRYMLSLFRLLGDDEPMAQKESADAMRVETTLARSELSPALARDPLRTYHPMSLASVQALAPGFDWARYFELLQVPKGTTLNVTQPIYLKALSGLLETTPLPAWRSYLRIRAMMPLGSFLSAPVRQATFRFTQQDLRGVPEMAPRAETCVDITDAQLGDAAGQDWLKQNFTYTRKAVAADVIEHLRAAFHNELAQQKWLSTSARREALKKLAAMQFFIAAPDRWRNYSSLRLTRGDFLADLRQVMVFNRQQEFGRIRSGSREHRWYWTVPTADANYDENENDIEIPAGVLQPPYLSEHASPAANYGAFGMLAGHEITHGFDDSGSHYDEHGRLLDWFTPEDKAGFDDMTSCEVTEYSRFEPIPGLRLDGRLEVGEITADNGGLRIAHDAFEQAMANAGASAEQRRQQEKDFFLAFGQIWCEERRPEYQRVRGQTDPHPPGRFRVNGAVQNLPSFGRTFGCHEGQPMMPVHACHVW